jgi:hypothetical protein
MVTYHDIGLNHISNFKVRGYIRRHDYQHNVIQQNGTQHNGLIGDTQHSNTQHNDTQHSNTQHNGLICDTQHSDTQHLDYLRHSALVTLSIIAP